MPHPPRNAPSTAAAVTQGLVALGLFMTVALEGCAAHAGPPAGYEWGLPVYPGAVLQGKSSARASFVLYQTSDSVDAVDAWYGAELPQGTQHVFDAQHAQATFALFDAHSRRTVHIEREGETTKIMLTKLVNP